MSADFVERVLRLIWETHFHIPEAVYWVSGVVGLGALYLEAPPSSWLWIFIIGLAILGVGRWRWHRRRSRLIVLTRFSSEAEHEDTARLMQSLAMTTLFDHLPTALHELVHSIPAVVGPSERRFASVLLKRLRCFELVHGRIEVRNDTPAVFARVALLAESGLTHIDWHSRDITPARADWGQIIHRLTPTESVRIEEYPLAFAYELQAVVRGFAGQIALVVGDAGRAEDLLRSAIDVAPTSTSHQIDELRVALAKALDAQDRKDEAIELLRTRAANTDPSPALLRTFAFMLGPRDEERPTAGARDEAIAALRRAAADETDPSRDMTLYNLAMLLAHQDHGSEAEDLLSELQRRSPYYKKAWYVDRHLGAFAYHRAEEADARAHYATAKREYELAARFYSRAIRRRPKVKILSSEGPLRLRFDVFPPSPILIANAVDAHRGVEHPLRTWWLEWKFQRVRARFLRIADRALAKSNWARAYAYSDWSVVGRHDSTEACALVAKAVSAKQLGRDDVAENSWAEAKELEPLTLVLRSEYAERFILPLGVPGTEPTEKASVLQELEQAGVVVFDERSSEGR
jgi:tetratricopeptide (TPR) repeat protein